MKKNIVPQENSFPEFFDSKASREEADPSAPLAVRMRPQTLDEIQGQEHLLAEGKLLRRTIQSDRWISMIFYGPPGSGKTTLARVISRTTQARFVPLNAVSAAVADLRRVIEEARKLKRLGKKTILFIDEIHRFNKAQQDVLMPDVESGQVILIGATTHNPSFSINGPLLSRSTVFELRPLAEEDLMNVLKRALEDPERGLGKVKVEAAEEALEHLARSASGDARRALNALEVGAMTTQPDEKGVIHFDRKAAEESAQKRIVYYDNGEDYHYDTASAFIKSMRGSDPDAAVYWLAKMIYAGEDMRFIIRRILILASEDIGNADPQALILASAGLQAVEFVGLPEARIILSQLVIYMALAPKSNAAYTAISSALEDVKNEKVEEVPTPLRDRSYPGAKKLGRGEGYQYPHTHPNEAIHQQYRLSTQRYYHPTQKGFEKTLFERLRQREKETADSPEKE